VNDGREKEMKHVTKLGITIITGVLALLFEFILHQPNWAYGIILITGSVMALMMFWEMIQTLREGKYGVDILAITAIVATLAVGEYWASLMILIMLTGGDSLEDYAAGKANQELKSLLDNSPQKAHRLNGENLEDVSVEEINVGDELVVKPGELVPVDGLVKTGTSTVDESSLTGESKPIEKNPGDELMSGSVNGDGSLKMVAEKTVADSQYQTIVNLVKESAARPAHFVRLADRYAVPFTLIAYLIAGVAWFVSKSPTRFAEVLVVASPCPLILSAPIALVAGMGRSSRHGVVIKSGTMVEKLASAKTIAFDKTGTLTKGIPAVTDIVTFDGNENELLTITAAIENGSQHPLASAIMRKAEENGLNFKGIVVEEFQSITGKGVKAKVNNQMYYVGSPNLFEELHKTIESNIKENITRMQIEGKTVMVLGTEKEILSLIAVADEMRETSRDVINKLNHIGIETVMLTGDNERTAQAIGKQVGVSDIKADLLPEDKLNFVKKLREKHQSVAMVGDGVNDAPALAAASVGVAMGGAGTDTALETADIALMSDDLSKLPYTIKLSRKALVIIKQNITFSLAIKLVALLLVMPGWLTLWIAIFADMGATLLVTLNSLRLLRVKE